MTDNTSMLERMVLAIYREFENRPCYAQAQMNGVIAEECARAALLAIREPERHEDDDLVYAGSSAITGEVGCPEVGSNYDAAKACFTAMIDAILSEDPTNGGVTP